MATRFLKLQSFLGTSCAVSNTPVPSSQPSSPSRGHQLRVLCSVRRNSAGTRGLPTARPWSAPAGHFRGHRSKCGALPMEGPESDSSNGPESRGTEGQASSSGASNGNGVSTNGSESFSTPENFCIIEGRDTVQDFAYMQLQEIRDNITSRRNKIFLLMEEVRRLRIQQRLKSREQNMEPEEEELPEYPSSIPFLPPLTRERLREKYYAIYFGLITSVIVFGGLVAPILELKLGLGGTSYADFITGLKLPAQLSEVDPIVASFSGGAVGVLTALMVVELNNVEKQEDKRCHYCQGTGYLACARCSATGSILEAEPALVTASSSSSGDEEGQGSKKGGRKLRSVRCVTCAGAGKVMCPTCLCTGMALATEHDPRIDPFD